LLHSTDGEFSNGKLEDLRFLTVKSANVSVRYTKINSKVHFPAVAFSVDIIRLILCKRTYIILSNIDDENPQIFQPIVAIWK